MKQPSWLVWVLLGFAGLVALKWVSSRTSVGIPPSIAGPAAASAVFVPGQRAGSSPNSSATVSQQPTPEGSPRSPELSASEKARLIAQYQRQGAAAFNRSDTDQALKSFLEAQELDPDNPEIFRWIERTREKVYKIEAKRREEEFRLRRGSKSAPGPLSNFQPAARAAAGSSGDRAAESDEDRGDSSEQVEEYTVRPEDVLQITVYEEPDLTTRARVSRNGEISFPMLGHVAVAGLTVTQVQERLTELLAKDYLVHPQIQVFIETSRSVFVTGEVVKPGSYPVSTERSTTLMEIIALAGGFTQKADLNGTRIIRIQNGEKKTIRVRVSDITKGDKSRDVTVRSDDMIFVPESFF